VVAERSVKHEDFSVVNRPSTLQELDWDRFTEAVEASFQVASRPQFFVWTQSALQGLVPHEILLCGFRETGKQSMLLQHFSTSRYFRQEHADAIADPEGGLMHRLDLAAAETGSSIVFSPLKENAEMLRPLDRLVEANELLNLAVALITGIDGSVLAYYGFARVSGTLDGLLRQRIELVLPHVHSTFVRVLTSERDAAAPTDNRAGRIVTPRQVEILMLIRDGKTNAEIADVLACSQWTIKNHIQNILRRLNTNSRAHALVRAMRLGILRPD
jgi:transcriptional regulator EpsA